MSTDVSVPRVGAAAADLLQHVAAEVFDEAIDADQLNAFSPTAAT